MNLINKVKYFGLMTELRWEKMMIKFKNSSKEFLNFVFYGILILVNYKNYV